MAAEAMETTHMPRYLIELEFPDGLDIPQNDAGANLCRTVVESNVEEGATPT